MTFESQMAAYIACCEEALERAAGKYLLEGSRVSEAARYSLMNGGKRVRGVLTLAVCDMLGASNAAAKRFSAAVEMIHAFSLIHDDLPCMDDDDLRRGKPSCHIAFGEATALLAGDLLSIMAFETIANAPGNADARLTAIQLLSAGSGGRGMIYGQELDLDAETRSISIEELQAVHRYKTGALIRTAALLGIAAAGAPLEEYTEIATYANNIGLVFQIVDDILDVTANTQDLGKPIGSDSEQGKTTFITLAGIEQSRREAERLTQEAVDSLQGTFGEPATFLCEMAVKLQTRAK